MSWKSRWLSAAMVMAGGLGTVQTVVADDGVFVGDEPAYIGDDMPAEAPAPAVQQQYAQPRATAQPAGHLMKRRAAPAAYAYESTCAAPCEPTCGACEPTCGVGCDACGPCGGGAFGSAVRNESNGWATGEFLLWFPQARETQPLITRADAGFAPLPGNPGYQVLYGGDINSSLAPGFRIDTGHYFGKGKLVGIGARAYMLADSEETFAAASNGDPSLGRYFYDFNIAPQILNRFDNALAIGLQNNFAGDVRAESELEYMGAEIYGRLVLSRDCTNQVDMLGGYSTMGLNDRLYIASNTIGIGVQPNNRTFVEDLFKTDNTFQGGHLGVDAKMYSGRFFMNVMSKVHLGNMNQQVNRIGRRATFDANNNLLNQANLGVLNTQNLGVFEQDTFAFAPEINLKLGVEVLPYTSLTIGYSFIYWSEIALADNQIDRAVDPLGQINPGPFEIQSEGFYLQGIDFGLTVNY